MDKPQGYEPCIERSSRSGDVNAAYVQRDWKDIHVFPNSLSHIHVEVERRILIPKVAGSSPAAVVIGL